MKILGICGSLRVASFNLQALRACESLLPPGLMLEIADISEIPMYNQDIFDRGVPAPVEHMRAQIRAADGVLIASPEYNFSVPAPLKNAIDWASRPPEQSFQEKPVALISASTGSLGGARVQYDLRRILGQLWAHVMPRPEIFIGNAASRFDTSGRLTDEPTIKLLRDQLQGFARWIERMQPR